MLEKYSPTLLAHQNHHNFLPHPNPTCKNISPVDPQSLHLCSFLSLSWTQKDTKYKSRCHWKTCPHPNHPKLLRNQELAHFSGAMHWLFFFFLSWPFFVIFFSFHFPVARGQCYWQKMTTWDRNMLLWLHEAWNHFSLLLYVTGQMTFSTILSHTQPPPSRMSKSAFTPKCRPTFVDDLI